MDPTLLERWLAARDAASIRAAWTALAPNVCEVGTRRLTREGAAQLAAAMLGGQEDWLVNEPPTPDFEIVDQIVPEVFVDHGWDITSECRCYFKLWEKREGVRGTQLLRVGCGSSSGQPDGAEYLFVRIVDRDRAVSVLVDTTKVAIIGDIDLAPLDLVRENASISYAVEADVGTVRGLIAQLAADVDAYYDTSAEWPAVDAGDIDIRWYGDSTKAYRFRDGGRAVGLIAEPARRRLSAWVEGMPWGHSIKLDLFGTSLTITAVLPATDIERVLTRFGALATVR